jgi:hypothetical protein
MRRRVHSAAGRAIAVVLLVAAALGALHVLGLGLRLLLALAIVIAFVAWALPALGVRWLDDAILALRSLYWARDQGRFHSFGGVPLRIEDDGRHMWVAGEGLMRVLGKREPEDVLAARHSGHWRRSDEGVLLLRVDAVVRHLTTMPGRDAPRVQRLRRYFERQVLYPAQRRRQAP